MSVLLFIVIILIAIVLLRTNKHFEHFYDWQTLGVDDTKVFEHHDAIGINGHSDCRTPHYQHDHAMFINTDCVGCGSCIYNPLDPSSDGVLPDWQVLLRMYGNTRYKSPPLDSEIYTVHGDCKCNPCN